VTIWKRVFDVVLAGGAACVTAPLVPLVAAAIRIDSPGGAFFRHSRLGRLGREIVLTKFRTMIAAAPDVFNADGSRRVGVRDPRVTRIGRALRGGLDEIPQLLAVVRGDLSLVGPRPDDLYAVDLYHGADWLKLAVRPGITGLAAVSGRNDVPWRTRLLYDIYYARHQSLWLDARIVLKTLGMALGVAQPGGIVALADAERYARTAGAIQAGERVAAEVRSYLAARAPDPRYSIPPERQPN
jgi:lipopolysaccharide/colanic/teichoic acid biosynthesis glycosyltransferase